MIWLLWSIPIGFVLLMFGIILLIIQADEREHKRAREGGCICQRGALVVWRRSDCPYCNPKRGKEEK